MSDVERALKVLTASFPDECNAIGQNNVKDLLSGEVTIVMPEEGRPFPYVEVFEFVKGAAEFTLTAISIYVALKETSKRKPTLRELELEIAGRQLETKNVSGEQTERILKEIARSE